MAGSWFRQAFVGFLVLAGACSDGRRADTDREGPVGVQQQSLTATQTRILGFEGTIGGSSGDWRAVTGTATSSTVHSEGTRSLSLSGGTSPSARSTSISTLGTLASQAAIDVQVPTSLQGQGWLGQVALTFNAPSAGVHNINAGAAALSGPVGTFRRYTIGIPPYVVTALNTHSYSDLTITVQLTVPNTSGAFLLDALTLTPGGGGGGSGGSSGAGGTAGNGGTSGGGISGGGVGGGQGGSAGSLSTGGTIGGAASGGVAGASGGVAGQGGATGGTAGTGGVAGGGTAGSTGTVVEEVIIDLPKNLQTPAVALGAYGNGGGLVINDGTQVVETSGGFANVTSVLTTVATDFGVNTKVRDAYSTPNLFVRGSHIYGNVWTSGGLIPSPQQQSQIDGAVQHHVSLDPIRRISWTVPFRTFAGDPTVVPEFGNLTLEPGGTRGITLMSNARLKLNRPGVYTLDGPFVMEPSSVLEVDNAGGQIELYIRKDFIFRGTIQKTDPRNNVLIVALGTGDQPIERRFNAILVAPRGNVQLATVTNGHQTSVYAKSILARPNTTITHTPFDPDGFCEEPRCQGLCPVATAIRQCQAGEPCSTEDDCVDDLTCQGGICVEPPDCASDPGACTPDCPCVPAGQPCLETDRCEGGLACANGTCSSLPTGSCAPTSVDDLNDCTLDGCFANGTIVHLQRVAGYPCTGGRCTEGAVCDLINDFGGRGQPPNPSGACSFGLVLGTNNGAFFGLPVETDVCWSELCALSPTAHCGGPSHLCGNCPWQGHPESSCNPSCAGKVCGDDRDDGCGGVCYLCEVGECGCSIDAECGLGKSCLTEGTETFGCGNGAGVCWPTACGDPGFRATHCGGPSSACGPCPQCTPQCDGRECGPDGCGADCGACAAGEYCDEATDSTAQCRARLASVLGPIPPAAIDPSSYVTQSVGTLAGTYDVSHDGQARYRIPIVVAPGRGSMQPQLTLSYDGSGRTGPPFGILGDGWWLEGIPVIARCPMTLAQDGIARGTGFLPPSPSPNDRFCLNGQRLRLVSGAYYGAPGSEYRTEMDSSVRVVVDEIEVGPIGGPSSDEPAQFSLFLPDGRLFRLRKPIAPNIWLPVFSKAQDTSGNTLSHGWGFDFGSQNLATAGPGYDRYLSGVSYAGHADGTVQDSFVRFSYIDRPDTRERYRHGMMLVETRLLDKLEVLVAGNLVREYRFTYITLSEGGSSQLATIRECVPTLPGSNDLACKPPTVFEYDNRPAGLSDPVPLGFKPNNAKDPSYDVKPEIVLDMDGDGLDDLLTEVVEAPGKYGAPIHLEILWGGRVTQNTGVAADLTLQSSYKVIDIDNDGRDDLLMERYDRTSGTYSVLTFKDDVFSVIDLGIPQSLPSSPGHMGSTYIVDADGDGLKDIVRCSGNKERSSTWEWTLIHVPDLTERHIAFSGWCFPHFIAAHLGDTDAEQLLIQTHYRRPRPDGGTDLVSKHRYAAISLNNARASDPGDVSAYITETDVEVSDADGIVGFPLDANGDGLTDIMVSNPIHGFAVHIAKPAPALADEFGMQYYGSPFFESKTSFGSVIGSVGGAYGYSTLRSELGEGYTLGPIVDVNADGRDDVLIASPGIPTWRVLEATPAAGQAFAGWTVKELAAPAPPSTWIYSETMRQQILAGRGYAMDINGDGVKDFVQKPTAMIAGAELAGYVRRGPQVRKLTAVTDGLGRRVEFEYGQLSAPRLPIEAEHPLKAFLSQVVYNEADPSACVTPQNFRCLPPRHSVVSRHRVLQGPQEFPAFSREFEHRYSSARIGLNGRGWLGFARHQMSEPATVQTKDFRFENVLFDEPSQSFPFAHQVSKMYERTTYLRADGETIVRTVSRERSSDLLRHPSSSQVVRPHSRTITERLEEGRIDITADILGEVTHTTDIDLFGNIKHVTTEWSGPDALSTDTLDVTYMHEEDPSFVNSWLVSLPRRRVVTSSGVVGESEQGTHTRTVEQDYFPTGLLRRVTVEPDRPELLVSTEFFRNAYGAVEVIETCGGSIDCDDEHKRTAVTSYDEDRRIFPRVVVDAEGYETEFTYHHGLGVITGSVQRGAEGSRELPTYSAADGFGRVRAIRYPDGRESHIDYERESLGGMNVISSDSGRPRVTVGYDPLGREVRRFTQTLGGEELAEFTRYNLFGEVFDVTRPMIQTGFGERQATEYDYDGLGRLRYRREPDGTVRETCHDGLVTCVRDGRENVRCMETDGRGRLRFAADPVPDVGQGCAGVAADFKDAPTSSRQGIQYVRGPFGAVERVVHAETGSNLVTVTSDPLGRPEQRTEAGVGTRNFTYTRFGQLESETDAQGTVTLGYDKLDRRISRDDADGHTEWTWRRDMPGRLDHSLTPDGTRSSVGYDDLGRADSFLREVGDEEFEARVTEWDDKGRTKVLSYPGEDGFAIENVYDEVSGILTKVHSVPPMGSSEEPQTYWQLDQINEFGQLEEESFGNGLVTRRTYHPLTGLPDSIRTLDPASEQAVQDLTHSYDRNGNLESKADLTQGATETFSYDEFDRLDLVWHNNSLVSDYEYTELGSLDTNGAGWKYEYEPGRPHAVHAVTNDGESSIFTYDSRGNLENRTAGVLPQLNVEYTPASKVRRVWEDDEGAAELFSYDADQVKVAKSSPRESVVYFGDLYYRVDNAATGSRVHHFVITNGQRAVAEVTRMQGGTQPAAVVYLHEDHLGSVSVLTKGAAGEGEVAERRNFGHFGAGGLPTGASLSSFGYTGHRQDQEHDLIDMKGRTYDPRVGQFLSPDPFVASPFMSGAFNRYAYVLNNPLKFVDPTGFQPCDGTSCGSGGAGGFGIRLPPSQGAEGAGNTSLSAAAFAPTFAAGVTASQDGAGGTTGVEAEATLGERALYFGAGVGVSVGTSYVIGKGVLLLCTATTVCTPVVIAVAVVGGTAYVVNELFFDGGAERIATAFTEHKTKEDALIIGQVLGGVGLGGVGLVRASLAKGAVQTVNLYRAVSPAEFADIVRVGGFRAAPGGGSLAAKQFALSLDEAVTFANLYPELAAIIRAEIPQSTFSQLQFSSAIDSFIFRNGVVTVQPGTQLQLLNQTLIVVEHAF